MPTISTRRHMRHSTGRVRASDHADTDATLAMPWRYHYVPEQDLRRIEHRIHDVALMHVVDVPQLGVHTKVQVAEHKNPRSSIQRRLHRGNAGSAAAGGRGVQYIADAPVVGQKPFHFIDRHQIMVLVTSSVVIEGVCSPIAHRGDGDACRKQGVAHLQAARRIVGMLLRPEAPCTRPAPPVKGRIG